MRCNRKAAKGSDDGEDWPSLLEHDACASLLFTAREWCVDRLDYTCTSSFVGLAIMNLLTVTMTIQSPLSDISLLALIQFAP